MFSGLEASLHDVFWSADGPPAELPLVDAFLAEYLRPDRSALELGCGSGRLLLPLLATGHPLEGLDDSAEMLALCRESAGQMGLEPHLHHQDIAKLDLPGRYGAITIPAFTLQLLPDPLAVLKSVRRHLFPEGGLYLTCFYPHDELSGEIPEGTWLHDRTVRMDDDRQAVLHTCHHIDREQQILTRHHRYQVVAPDGAAGEAHESSQHLRYFVPDQWEKLLVSAGFGPDLLIADMDPGSDISPEEALTLTMSASRA